MIYIFILYNYCKCVSQILILKYVIFIWQNYTIIIIICAQIMWFVPVQVIARLHLILLELRVVLHVVLPEGVWLTPPVQAPVYSVSKSELRLHCFIIRSYFIKLGLK